MNPIQIADSLLTIPAIVCEDRATATVFIAHPCGPNHENFVRTVERYRRRRGWRISTLFPQAPRMNPHALAEIMSDTTTLLEIDR